MSDSAASLGVIYIRRRITAYSHIRASIAWCWPKGLNNSYEVSCRALGFVVGSGDRCPSGPPGCHHGGHAAPSDLGRLAITYRPVRSAAADIGGGDRAKVVRGICESDKRAVGRLL